MTGLARAVVMLVISMAILVSGCGIKTRESRQVKEPQSFAVNCIGVLPAVSGIDYEGRALPEQVKGLQKGVQVMNDFLRQELGGLKDIHFVSGNQVAGLQESVITKPLDLARLAGKQLGCNAVLETTVSKYIDRVGGRYTAKTPASVSFALRLIEIESGAVLCRSNFDEVQEPALENIYKWHKARARAFTWVSAQELMSEGLKEKLSSCSYLQSR